METKIEEGMKTVQISEDLWAKAKIASVKDRVTLREWLERAVKLALAKGDSLK